MRLQAFTMTGSKIHALPLGRYLNPNISALKTSPSVSLPAGRYANTFNFLNFLSPIKVTSVSCLKSMIPWQLSSLHH